VPKLGVLKVWISRLDRENPEFEREGAVETY
jgi:hypothetical protein